MADVRAFRAFRYDLGRVGALSDVIAPPYDVIAPGLQDALYARSPYNVVRLILNKEAPSDTETENRYTRAARCLRDWQQNFDICRARRLLHRKLIRVLSALELFPRRIDISPANPYTAAFSRGTL